MSDVPKPKAFNYGLDEAQEARAHKLHEVGLPAVSQRVRSDWVRQSKGRDYPKKEYDTKFGLDFVQGGVAFDPDFAAMTGAQLGFTDLLGNHRIGILFANVGDNLNQFFKHVNVGVSYTNLTNRLNYTVGAFHLTQAYDPVRDIFRYLAEKMTGSSAA